MPTTKSGPALITGLAATLRFSVKVALAIKLLREGRADNIA